MSTLSITGGKDLSQAIADAGASFQVTAASGTATSSGNNTLVTPASGKKIRLFYASYNPDAPTTLGFRFGAAGATFLNNKITVAASIVAKDLNYKRYLEGAVNEALILNQDAAVNTIWNILYLEV